MAFDSEEANKKREAAAEERKQQSRNMVGETIKKGLAESKANLLPPLEKTILTYSLEEAQHPGKEIDDTDGLDPEGEFNAWRMRELMRLKREKEEEQRREEERLEIERRRAMPEEQRLKEDLERAQKLRDEKPKTKQPFLQKYWHKGAFYQVRKEMLYMREPFSLGCLGYGRAKKS
jgi:microfibrillar-associated protein 1